MNTDCTLKRIMAGALLSGVAVAGLGLAAGTAQALPGPAPRYMWCPGTLIRHGHSRASGIYAGERPSACPGCSEEL
jgi:hypothetical protein